MTHQRLLRGLYLLAAVVLLLQSFAIWHDVEHPFHQAELQCERLDAINHAPAVDHTTTLAVIPAGFSTSQVIKPSGSIVSDRKPATSSIRGPPRHA